MKRGTIVLLFISFAWTPIFAEGQAPKGQVPKGQVYAKQGSFTETMLASRRALRASSASGRQRAEANQEARRQIMADFAVEFDWMLQDNGSDLRRWFNASDDADIETKMISRVLDEIGDKGEDLISAFEQLRRQKVAGGDPDAGPVRWLNAQSIPPLLPPYYAGSAKSPLIDMLETGHNSVKLSREEMERIACWIDLLVPYCGDYMEANCWNEDESKKYLHYQTKREAMAAAEADNIRRLISPLESAAGASSVE